MSIFMRKKPKAAIALLCLLAVFTWLTLSPMSEAQAVAVVDDLTIWGLIALLSGWGVSFAAKDASKTDLLDTMRDLIDKAGVAAEALTEGAAIVASPGILKLRPSLVAAGAQVVNWIKDQVGSGTGTFVVSSSGFPVVLMESGQWFSVPINNSSYSVSESGVYLSYVADKSFKQPCLIFLSAMPFTITASLYGGSRTQSYPAVSRTVGNISCYWRELRWSLSSEFGSEYEWSLTHCNMWSDGTGTLADNLAMQLFSGAASGADVSSYLTDAAAPTAEPTAPVYVTAPGLTYDTPAQVADSWYDHVTADPEDRTYPVTQAVPNIIDAAAIQSGAGTAEDIDPDLDPVIGLVDVFPFCIPFDIYNFLALFNHTREAPSVTIPLALPEYIGGTQEITIDLSSWEPVARILRTVELIAFIVGLAFETRKFIKW